MVQNDLSVGDERRLFFTCASQGLGSKVRFLTLVTQKEDWNIRRLVIHSGNILVSHGNAFQLDCSIRPPFKLQASQQAFYEFRRVIKACHLPNL